MSQNSLLELLSVTSNAVKALDRTHSSKSSNSDGGTPRGEKKRPNVYENQPAEEQDARTQSVSKSNFDSGVGTATVSGQIAQRRDSPRAEEDSGDSTTASDVLIRSTVAEDKLPDKPPSLNASVSSQGSRCRDLDNFNVDDAAKVKVSRKHLREIVSSRDSFDSSGSGQAESGSNQNKHAVSVTDLSSRKSAGTSNGKIINGLSDRGPGRFQQTRRPEIDSSTSRQRKMLNQGRDDGSLPSYTVERHDSDRNKGSTKPKDKNVVEVDDEQQGKTAQPSYFPYKVGRHDGSSKEQMFVEEQEDFDDEESATSSQPEIVTVSERVINISSQALTLSDYEDGASHDGAVEAVVAVNRPQSFPNPRPKTQGPGLRQGALSRGPALAGERQGKGDEVQISKFSLTDKQRELKEALAKRGSQSRPVRRVVQPKLVPSSASSVSEDDLNKNNNMDREGGSGGGGGVGNVESITAAVAASAAVAATQPFLKMQQELENKMQTLLSEMERVQKGGAAAGQGQGQSQGQASNPNLEVLERQVRELTEQRLQHLEVLQSQQMEVQAHLLSMSRGISQTQHQKPSVYPSYFPTATSTTTHPPSYNRALIERELMKGRLQGDATEGYMGKGHGTGGYGFGGHGMKQDEGSVLDTPNPRGQPPQPAQFGGGKGGLLQEILAAEPSPQLNTTFNLPSGQTPPSKLSRARPRDGGSPVEKARKLVLDLSNLEDRTAESIWREQKTGRGGKDRPRLDDPAPLDHYLKQVRDPNTAPYSKMGHGRKDGGVSSTSHHHHHHHNNYPHLSSNSKTRASGSKGVRTVDLTVQDKYGEARSVLEGVVAEKETLENNLQLLLRSRQDTVDVFSLMAEVGMADRPPMTRIQKMVEKRISSMKDEVKREVEWDLQHAKLTTTTATRSTSLHDVGRRPAVRSTGVGFGSGAPRSSAVTAGPRRSQSATEATAKFRAPSKGKVAPKKSKPPSEDEGVQTQLYGKAGYQKGRTTVKDPYLHLQNQPRQRAPRLPSPKRADGFRDVKSSKSQAGEGFLTQDGRNAEQLEGRAPRQYYFSPTMGYVPLTSSASAPVAGQLVSMAIPLGKPRLDAGLAVAPEDHAYPVSTQSTSAPIRPVVTAATNVAMVAMTTQDDHSEERVRELGKQVLPAVDIDSISPSSSPRGSDIHLKEPDNAGYLQTFHYQESEGEDDDGDRTLTGEASDEDADQEGTGISLPGHHQPTPARDLGATAGRNLLAQRSAQKLAAQVPQQLREDGRVPWEERSDELAEDLRTRDLLQNKAKYWLEQELMARMLMKMHPVMSAQAEVLAEPEGAADRSDSIPDDESLIVGDTIGQRGLQLFVDAGQPINNQLVNALVREVIAEKVGGMLGRRREADAADGAGETKVGRAEVKDRAGTVALGESQLDMGRGSRQPERVPTPQPTPRTSPVPGYVSHHAPVTPPLTPPPPPLPPRERSPVKDISSESSAPAPALLSAATSITPKLDPEPTPVAAPTAVYESETEISASLDLSEELRALEDKMKEAQMTTAASYPEGPQHDVVTPTTTPPPTPPAQPSTDKPTVTPSPSPPPRVPTPPPAAVPVAPPVMPEVKAVAQEAKSPQPWGDPLSPGPELNPSYEAPLDVALSQPKPLVMSVGIGTDTMPQPRRSPSPQRRQTRESSEQWDAESVSSPSTTSLTPNENISEGQWLVSRSEGQVAGLPLMDDVHKMAVNAARRADISTASTLRDTDDLDLDTDVSQSEGEFLHKGDIMNPETDPVLALLLQNNRSVGFGQYDLPADRVQQVLSAPGRNGGDPRKSMGELSEGQVLPGNQHHHVTMVTPKAKSPSPPPTSVLNQRADRSGSRNQNGDERRSPSPNGRRVQNDDARKAPPSQPVVTGSSRGRQQQYQPVSSGLPPSHSRRPLKSALVRSSDDSRNSRDSEQDYERRGPATEYGTRSLTPDQLNTDLLQTGYTGRSMGSSGRTGVAKKSVDFDLSGTQELTRSRESSYRDSSVRGSTDDGFNYSDRLGSSGRSLGLRYSMEDSTSDRDPRDTHLSMGLRMSVTLPSTQGASDSDVSEIDLSENTGY